MNYRIIEWFELKETFKIIQFQTPSHEKGCLPLDQNQKLGLPIFTTKNKFCVTKLLEEW